MQQDRKVTILCFGDSNTWGAIPGPVDPDTGLPARFQRDQRWTQVLQDELGDRFEVIESGLNGRVTLSNPTDPKRPFISGIQFLPFVLEMHSPIDIVIFYLGINDTKTKFDCSAEKIAENMRQLINLVKKSNRGPNGRSSQILLLAPQPLLKNSPSYPQFDQNSISKSQQLAFFYHKMAQEEGCAFLDLAKIITSSEIDGLHLDASQHRMLGKALAKIINS